MSPLRRHPDCPCRRSSCRPNPGRCHGRSRPIRCRHRTRCPSRRCSNRHRWGHRRRSRWRRSRWRRSRRRWSRWRRSRRPWHPNRHCPHRRSHLGPPSRLASRGCRSPPAGCRFRPRWPEGRRGRDHRERRGRCRRCRCTERRSRGESQPSAGSSWRSFPHEDSSRRPSRPRILRPSRGELLHQPCAPKASGPPQVSPVDTNPEIIEKLAQIVDKSVESDVKSGSLIMVNFV